MIITSEQIKQTLTEELHNKVASRIRVGDIYFDCAYHPVLATEVSYRNDQFVGISLINGSYPRGCSYKHCGITKMNISTAMFLRNNWNTFHRPITQSLIDGGWRDGKVEDYDVKEWSVVCKEIIENGFEYKIKSLERYLENSCII